MLAEKFEKLERTVSQVKYEQNDHIQKKFIIPRNYDTFTHSHRTHDERTITYNELYKQYKMLHDDHAKNHLLPEQLEASRGVITDLKEHVKELERRLALKPVRPPAPLIAVSTVRAESLLDRTVVTPLDRTAPLLTHTSLTGPGQGIGQDSHARPDDLRRAQETLHEGG